MNERTLTVLVRLRQVAECDVGNGWSHVYLDNARCGMNDKIFRAALSQLAKEGFYKVIDGWAWGSVKMA